MNPLLYSRQMRLNQLPEVIYLPGELDEAIRRKTTKGLQQHPPAEANAVVCYSGDKYYLDDPAFGSSNASSTLHTAANRIGLYHSHPQGSRIDVGDFRQMLLSERRIENFSLVDGAGDRRSVLFKTLDSPTMLTNSIIQAQSAYDRAHPVGYNPSQKELDSILEVARCAFMGYYEGRGLALYRVYPK